MFFSLVQTNFFQQDQNNMNGISRRTFLGRTALAVGACTVVSDHSPRAALPERLHPPHQDAQDHHDPHLHLFLDDNDVAHKENLLLVLIKMRKHPAPGPNRSSGHCPLSACCPHFRHRPQVIRATEPMAINRIPAGSGTMLNPRSLRTPSSMSPSVRIPGP